MILPDMPNLAEIAFLMHQMEEELEIQSRVVKARALDAGTFDEALATQTAGYLLHGNAEDIAGINLMSIVLRTVLRRLDITGWKSSDANLTTWAENVWDANAMDTKQGDVHRPAERDGEAFVIVDYDATAERPWEPEKSGRPVFYIHERFTSPEAGWRDEVGSGEGCKAHYRNNDPNQTLDMVSKRWTETTWENGEPTTAQRMTLYIAKQRQTPARIEKYIAADGGEWEPYTETTVDADGREVEESWPIWWTEDGTPTGKSLPIPVVHFRNEELQPLTQRLWGLQDGMDHGWSALLGGMTLSAHQILVAFGFFPTTDGKPPKADGSNLIKVSPRTILGSSERKPGDASLEALDAADPRPVLEAIDKIAVYCAFVSGMPLANFMFSKAIASAETLQQGESDFVAHVNALWRLFGRSWAQVMSLARMLDNLYGGANLDERAKVEPVWAQAETTNVKSQNEEAQIQLEAGIPEEFVWRHVWGYDDNQIKQIKELKAQAAGMAPAASPDPAGDGQQPNGAADE